MAEFTIPARPRSVSTTGNWKQSPKASSRVVLTLLGLAGMVNSAMLWKGWRYSVFAVVVVAAIVTPPDPISQLLLATPIIALYFVSIGCVKLIELRRKKDDAAAGTDIVSLP